MSGITGPGSRHSIGKSMPGIDIEPRHVQSQAKAKSAGKGAKAGKSAATDRSVTARGSDGASGAKALAQAKEKLITGDNIAKFTTGLRDFGGFAAKLGKGIGSADQFLGKLGGILEKTLTGLQDAMQFAEKLGGLENQVKGSFDSLNGVVKSTLQFVDALKGLLGAAPGAALPGAAAPAAPQTAAGPAAPQTAAGPAAPQTAAGPAAPQTAAGPAAPQTAAGPAAPQTAAAPTASPGAAFDRDVAPTAQNPYGLPELNWKPDSGRREITDAGHGTGTQLDMRNSGGTTTTYKEVIEKKQVTEMQSVEKVRDLPGKTKTESAVFYPNDIPKPGTERTVTPENKKYATDFIDKNLDDLKKPGAKLDITGLCSAPASDAYNMALGTRRAVNTREAFAQVLSEKGFSQEKINELLPKESELKSKGNREAKVPAKPADLEKQGADRRTDVTLTLPGGKEKYTEQVPVTKEIEVKKQVPVQVQKPMNSSADLQVGGPGMGVNVHVEMVQNPDGSFSVNSGPAKTYMDTNKIMGNYFGGANDPVAALNQQLNLQQPNLGAFAGPVNNLVLGALNGNPSVAPFQGPLQDFGQAVRNDVLSRPDLTPSTRKSVDAMAGRLDGAAKTTLTDMQKSVDAYLAGLQGGSSFMGKGPIGNVSY